MSSPASYRPHSLYDLSARVALVTGGGTGIGLLCAQGLAASGAKVYITGRRFEILEKVSGAWDKQAYIEEKEGKLHVLVNKFVR